MMLKKLKKFVLLLLVILVIVVLFATSYILWIQPIDSHTPGATIGIARKTTASPKKLVKLKKIRKPNRKNSEVPRIDLRSKDLTELDLTDYAGELSRAIFDSETQWPEKLPIGFDPKNVWSWVKILDWVSGRFIKKGLLEKVSRLELLIKRF